MTTVVFLGPTLSAREAAEILPATYLPPVRQGDVYRAMRDRRPTAIGVIDGVFLEAPSVWHREILWALACGVHVFGAASMGALRAAELAPFGMRGVGRIFEAYRDGCWPGFDAPFEDDDEVAVIHAPAEAGSFALSDAMVDLRATLLAGEAAGVISRERRDALAAEMKQRHFSARGIAALADAAGGAAGAWITSNHISRKRLDALEMLRDMSVLLAGTPAPFRPRFRFTPALVWQHFMDAANAEDRAKLARAVWEDWLMADE